MPLTVVYFAGAVTGPPGGGRFSRPYGPWTGMAIMAAWTAVALICGFLVLARADAASGSRPGRGKRAPR